MELSFDEAKKVKKEFVEEYLLREPFKEYLNSVGISNIRLMTKHTNRAMALKENETLDDLCLSATFRKTPPQDVQFPEIYQGVRVFYKVVGVIRAL